MKKIILCLTIFTSVNSFTSELPECSNEKIIKSEKIAVCDQIIDGNVDDSSRATYVAFYADYVKETIAYTPCDSRQPKITRIEYKVKRDYSAPKNSLTGLKSGMDYGNPYIEFAPATSVEDDNLIKTEMKLRGVPSVTNTAIFDKTTQQLTLKSKSYHYFSDGIVANILLQCH
ncbi:MAG: hypothetical protein Q7U04_07910, partial [Bacteriovorax sp.]|nr:hypothetical protein [Bacteriovorax sp.]